MSPSKPANPVRNYAVGSAIAALILLGPVAALLMVAAAEMLIDLLIVGGTSAVCAVAAGGIGLVLSRGKVIRWRISPGRNWYPEIRPLLPHRCDVATASLVSLCNVDERRRPSVPGRNGADYPRPRPGCGDRRRGAWIARSDWNWGTLDRLDPVTGAPQRRYGIAPGTEGLAFGNTGRLWAVSEAGSRHIYDHPFLGLFQPWMSRGKVPDSGQPQHDGWLGETYGAE